MSNLIRVSCPRAPAQFKTWEVLPSLTDTEGELLDDNMDASAYHQLLTNGPLLDRLRSQLPREVPEATVAQLHGRLGILLQMTFPCAESDGEQYQRRAALQEKLGTALIEIMDAHPEVEAAIPWSEYIFRERVAAWVFFPDGLMNRDAITALQASIDRRGQA